MSPISIPCPSCSSLLKVPDSSFIGKRAKCPKCSHRFELTLPDEEEVSLQLADDVPVLPAAPMTPQAPLMGTSAKWVPDDIPTMPPAGFGNLQFAPPGAELPGAGASQFAGIAGGDAPVMPSSDGIAAANPFDFSALESTSTTDQRQSTATANAATAGTPANTTQPVGRAGAGARAGRRRRSNTGGLIAMAVTAVVVTGIAGVAFWKSQQPEVVVQAKEPAKVNAAWEQQKAEQVSTNASVEKLSPTSGKPIPLDFLPFTPHVLVHLRPAELWKSDNATREFQAMLGNLGTWLSEEILRRTKFEPKDISELTIAINFGPRMTPPEVAVVVRLREPQTESDLMRRFAGRMRAPPASDPRVEVYEADEFCFLKVDRSTFAVAPIALAEELSLSARDAALASPDMEPLLQKSDRDRHATVLFDLKLLDSHREDIFIEPMQKIADQFVIWMGEEIETVSWSLHLQPNFYMETLLHNTTDSSVLKVQRHAQLQLSRLSENILASVRRMRPATVGTRQIVGRFPAMVQALDVGTTAHVTPEFARLVTILPAKAAANLAAGTLLTWNESLIALPDDALTQTSGTSIPDKIADRLKLKVLIDFRQTPLQEAFGYIADAIKTEATIDGKALQGAGFTQVMPQTLNLGTVTAQEGLYGIVSRYEKERDPLALVVDEAGQKLILTTVSKATADGLKTFELAPK